MLPVPLSPAGTTIYIDTAGELGNRVGWASERTHLEPQDGRQAHFRAAIAMLFRAASACQ